MADVQLSHLWTDIDTYLDQVRDGATGWDAKEDGLGNPVTDADILSSTIAGVRSWITPVSAPVDSVAGKTGVVVLDTDDISEAANLYYTEVRVSANSDVAANTAHRTSDGTDHLLIEENIRRAYLAGV